MIVKFRTMKVNADTTTHERYLEHLMVADCPMIKLDEQGDPRLIAGGKILRAMGLDELPQIFNVLTGEMSLIGPRPCTVREFERFSPPHRERVNAYPGLTGWWQVNGKNQTTFREMIEMDIFYSRNVSLSLDLRILVRTFPAIANQVRGSWQRHSRASTRRARRCAELTVDRGPRVRTPFPPPREGRPDSGESAPCPRHLLFAILF